MKHYIDPKVDCVFKAILGKQENEALLIDFLNNAIAPKEPITQAIIANPYNEKTRLNAKLSIVDVKVKDQKGRIYQIEIQLTSPSHLNSRIIYTASQLHCGQGVEGENYDDIKPSIAIWLLSNDIPLFDNNDQPYIVQDGDSHFKFHFADTNKNVILGKDIEIHLFALNHWIKPETINGFDYWLYFFTHAHRWKVLPPEVKSSILLEAMKVLEQFSEQEESYHTYISRQQARMKERSMEAQWQQAMDARDKAFEARDNAFEARDTAFEARDNAFEARDTAFEARDNAFEALEQSKAQNAALLKRIAELEKKSQ